MIISIDVLYLIYKQLAMKKVLIYGLLAIAMIVVSCQKVQIEPNSGTMSEPVWEESGEKSGDEDGAKPNNEDEDLNRITDPNEDPDSNPGGNPNGASGNG